MRISACSALLLLLCNPISSQEKNISTSVLVINSINVFEKSKLGNDILFAFQDAALELKKEADLNAKKFEDEELELTQKREVLAKKDFNELIIKVNPNLLLERKFLNG